MSEFIVLLKREPWLACRPEAYEIRRETPCKLVIVPTTRSGTTPMEYSKTVWKRDFVGQRFQSVAEAFDMIDRWRTQTGQDTWEDLVFKAGIAAEGYRHAANKHRNEFFSNIPDTNE